MPVGIEARIRFAIPRDNLLPSLFWTFVYGGTVRFSDHVEKREPAPVLETSKDAITTTPNGMEGALPLACGPPRSIWGTGMALLGPETVTWKTMLTNSIRETAFVEIPQHPAMPDRILPCLAGRAETR
jgi:hypothetical protein